MKSQKYKQRVEITESKRKEVLKRDNYLCVYCQDDADCIDHIIPQKYTIENRSFNLVASCTLCNLIASDKVFKTFQDKRDFILRRRNRLLKKPIMIWTKEEMQEFSYKLKKEIEKDCIVVDNIDIAVRTLERLTKQGIPCKLG